METTYNGYATEGYTIAGLARIANKEHTLHLDRASKSKYGNRYTQADRDRVKALRAEGKTFKEIAEIMHINVRVAEHLCYRDLKPKAQRNYPCKMNEEQIQRMLELFPTTCNSELAKMFGCSREHIYRLAHSRGVYKNQEHIDGWMKRNCAKSKTPEVYAKQRASYAKTRAREKRRILYGMDQQTKLKIVAEPRAKSDFRYRMKKERHYIVMEKGSNTLYYDEQTKRDAIMEQKAIAHGFDIKSFNS